MKDYSSSTLESSAATPALRVGTTSSTPLKTSSLPVWKPGTATTIAKVTTIISAWPSPTSTTSSSGAKATTTTSIFISGSGRPSVSRPPPWSPRSGVREGTEVPPLPPSAPLAGTRSGVLPPTSTSTPLLQATTTKVGENLRLELISRWKSPFLQMGPSRSNSLPAYPEYTPTAAVRLTWVRV